MLAIVWISWVNGVQAASDVVSEVERAVEQYSKLACDSDDGPVARLLASA